MPNTRSSILAFQHLHFFGPSARIIILISTPFSPYNQHNERQGEGGEEGTHHKSTPTSMSNGCVLQKLHKNPIFRITPNNSSKIIQYKINNFSLNFPFPNPLQVDFDSETSYNAYERCIDELSNPRTVSNGCLLQ